ncbi:MAG: 4Fe-4S binding protein [Staphylothermus sp.]|nr:4Fe-4S binding protein [Staphylothermus sp.]
MGKPKILDLILRNLLSKPSTIEYPKKETVIEPDARGRHYADLNKCIGCSLCSIECPADAIKMTPIPPEYEAPKRNPRKLYPVINYLRCIYCYRCIAVCPTNAYVSTNEYRLATTETIYSDMLSLSTLPKKTG